MTGRIERLAIAVAVLLAVGGCGSTPSPTASDPAGTPAVDGSASAAAAGVGAPIEEDIAHAMSQRKLFGLRSDEAWVRQIAADPRARTQLLDFPMLPEEETEFEARQSSYESVAAAVNAYAADHRAEFGGVWIDQPRHTVVAAWTANPELHRLGILASLRAAGPLEVRLVRYTEQQLTDLTDRLFMDRGWYATIPAAPLGGGADTMNNRVDFEISSANPQAAVLILAHYGVGPDVLHISSDGTGIRLQPRGKIEGRVTTADGKEPGENQLMLNWSSDRPAAGAGDCGDMVGYGVAPDGAFELPCAPGGWTITVQASSGDGWVDVGSGHAVVPAGGTVKLMITLEKGAKLNP
jgi:hypothetical protein